MPSAQESATVATPANLAELRSALLAERARPKVHSKRAMQVLAGLLDSPRNTAMYSITRLAEQQGVHASTLTRLAKKLGYAGFPEFQSVFRQHVSDDGHFYSQQADQLLQKARRAQGADASRNLIAQVTGTEMDNIARMRQDLDPEALTHAARLLARAPRVRTHGLRQSFAISVYLSYVLGLLRDDVSVLGSFEHGSAHSLAQLTEDDVLVVVGFRPYTRRTVLAGEMAARHGLKVIAISDSHASPISAIASHDFVTPATGAFVSNSLGAAFVLAETIVSMVAQELGEAAIASLERREQFIEEEKIEV